MQYPTRLNANTSSHFRLGNCFVDVTAYQLQFDNDHRISLQAKFIEVLQVLARHQPHVVTRDQLIDEVWNGNALIGQNALTNAIWQLRQALSDSDVTDNCIETVRKSGYRLTLPVEFLPFAAASTKTESEPATSNARIATFPPPDKVAHKTSRRTNFYIVAGALLTSCGLIASILFKQTPPPSLPPSPAQTVTHSAGREMYPALSTDGRYLVYLRATAQLPRSLFIKDMRHVDREDKKIETDHEQESAAIWDGDDHALIFAAKLHSGECYLQRYTVSDHHIENIARCELPLPTQLALSPDQRYLAFTLQNQLVQIDRQQTNAATTLLPCNAPCPIGTISGDMAYSPDGKAIVFGRRLSMLIEDLYWMELATGVTTRITSGHQDIRGVHFSSDPDVLVYGAVDNMRRDGYVLNLRTDNKRALHASGLSFPFVTPHDNAIYFHYWSRHHSIGSVQWPERGAPLPLIGSVHHFEHADYSAAADAYVLVSNQDGLSSLWIYDANRLTNYKLTQGTLPVSYPSWSPDGKQIVYTTPKPDYSGDDIYIVDVATRIRRKISTSLSAPYHPFWFPDQNYLIVAAKIMGRTEVYRVNIGNGDSERLTDEEARMAKVDKDGQIYFTRKNNDGLWRLNPSGEHERVTDKRCNTNYNWTITTNGYFCEHSTQMHNEILFFPKNNGPVQMVAQLPEGMLSEVGVLSYDEKRKRLSFTLDTPSEADIMYLPPISLP